MTKVVGRAPDGWAAVPLADAAFLQRGFDITKADQVEGPYPVISSSGPSSTHAEFKVAGPGVVTGRKGSLGGVFYVETPFWPHDTTLWVANFHGNDPRFIAYLLQTLDLARLDAGASNPTLNRNHIHGLTVHIPPLGTQQKITTILSAYDDLIESNNRRVEILDEMAQRIYREWFTHFRYPGHEDARLVESELGLIPERWVTARLDTVCGIVLGGTPSRSKPEYWVDGTIPWVNSGKVNDLRVVEPSELITEEALARSAAKMMPMGTTLVAITGATLGQVSLLEIDACANQSVVGICPQKGPQREYVYLFVRNAISEIIAAASGGAQQHINKGVVGGTLITLPPESLEREFRTHVAPMFDEIAVLLRANSSLASARDLLLPRLLSGEIDVTDSDIDVPEAA